MVHGAALLRACSQSFGLELTPPYLGSSRTRPPYVYLELMVYTVPIFIAYAEVLQAMGILARLETCGCAPNPEVKCLWILWSCTQTITSLLGLANASGHHLWDGSKSLSGVLVPADRISYWSCTFIPSHVGNVFHRQLQLHVYWYHTGIK